MQNPNNPGGSNNNPVHEEIWRAIQRTEPEHRNREALRQLYRFCQVNMDKIKRTDRRDRQWMALVSMTVLTVSYLLGVMDNEFLETFLKDVRNEPLIRRLRNLEQTYSDWLRERRFNSSSSR